MLRRSAASALRLLCRGLQAEAGPATRSIATRSLLVGSPLTGHVQSRGSSAASPFLGSLGSVRRYSDMEPFSGIYYPENEAEVGCPAPDFTCQGQGS
jgi:hypothetical protein